MTKLNELTFDELKALFDKNHWLREEAKEWQDRMNNEYLDDIAGYLRNIKGLDFSIGYDRDAHVTASANCLNEYLEALKALCLELCFFDPETEKLINRLADKVRFYQYCVWGYEDISEEQFQKLDTWFESGLEEIESEIVSKTYDIATDYSEDGLLDALDQFACIDGDEYETDGTYIYEIGRRKFA